MKNEDNRVIYPDLSELTEEEMDTLQERVTAVYEECVDHIYQRFTDELGGVPPMMILINGPQGASIASSFPVEHRFDFLTDYISYVAPEAGKEAAQVFQCSVDDIDKMPDIVRAAIAEAKGEKH